MRIKLLLLFLLAACSCESQNNEHIKIKHTETMASNANLDSNNIEIIKKQFDLQKRAYYTGELDPSISSYFLKKIDIDAIFPIIQEGLKRNGYITPGNEDYNKIVRNLFGCEFENDPWKGYQYTDPHAKWQSPQIFIHFFSERYPEFDEMSTFIVLTSGNYRFITDIYFLRDIIQFNSDGSYKINIPQYIISRNKFLFNNSKADIPYLVHHDSDFVYTLVADFGYTKNDLFNAVAMNWYERKDKFVEKVGDIIFVKNNTGNLVVRQDLLDYISNHTTINNNKLLQDGLATYAYKLYEVKGAPVSIASQKFTLAEKRKIVAYVTSVYDPLYHKYKVDYSGTALWHAATPIENIAVEDKGIIEEFRQNNYYNIPGLKEIIENADIRSAQPLER